MEMPAIQRLQDRTAGIGLVVLAVNVKESAARVRTFAQKQGIAFRSLLDPTGRVSARYEVKTLPFTVIIDRGGRVRAVAEGPRDWDSTGIVALVLRVAGEKY
jgi:peroxiredoxin